MANVRDFDLGEVDRELALFYAEVADQAEDYQVMKKYMKYVAEWGIEFSKYERKLFHTAYCRLIEQRKVSWATLSRLDRGEESQIDAAKINRYKQIIENEITNICEEVLTVIRRHLIPIKPTSTNISTNSFVFYHKMRGEYYMYRSQIKFGPDRIADERLARGAYTLAWEKAADGLAPRNPTRLNLAVKLALLHLEFLDNCSCVKVANEALVGVHVEAYKPDDSGEHSEITNLWIMKLSELALSI